MAISKTEFLEAFDHLLELEAQGADLTGWYAASAALQDRVLEDRALSKWVPQIAWNWFTDFDVRSLDPEYAREQRRDLDRALAPLRAKTIKSSG